MELQLLLIRNGLYQKNAAQESAGIVDMPLTHEERERIGALAVKERIPAQIVFSSPMAQCVQTARLFFPHKPAILMDGLRPMDAGDFNGMAYEAVVKDKQFERWGGAKEVFGFGGGEDPYRFRARSIFAFRDIVYEIEKKQITSGAIFTHQMVINCILQRFCIPRTYYNDWTVDYGGGYLLSLDTTYLALKIIKKIEK